MDRAVRLPGLRALDRNFDRLPESLRWLVERVVHDPDAGAAPKPEIPPALREQLASLFHDDVARLERVAGPQLRLARLAPAEAAGAPKLLACACRSGRRAGRGRRGDRRGAAHAGATTRSPTARSATPSATTGRGRARPRPGTSPRAAPSRRSSAAGRAPAPRSPPTRCRACGPRSAPTRRRPPAPAGGTTPTCSRSACAPPPRRSSARSSTPGSTPSPAPTPTTAPTSAHLSEIEAPSRRV